jgi:hypothetical protein
LATERESSVGYYRMRTKTTSRVLSGIVQIDVDHHWRK